MTITNKNARDDRASVLRKVENNDARGKKKAPRRQFSRSPTPAAGGPDRQTKKPEFRQKANKFTPNGPLSADVSVPNVVRKYAFCDEDCAAFEFKSNRCANQSWTV